MEVKEADRIVIAKPVPLRPTRSSFGSFSELHTGAITASPTNACSETAVKAIRPRTVRFKPALNYAHIGKDYSQAGKASGGAVCYSLDKFINSDCKSSVVYKPLAKLASKTSVFLMENPGHSNIGHQKTGPWVEHQHQALDQVRHHVKSSLSSNIHENLPSQSGTEKIIEPSDIATEKLEEDQKSFPPGSSDRPSYDGYNWRKYGQKQVKGSEHPRSYYKCTHPNCPVKKKVEKSLDGQITEIVYKGEHNHSKPQPPRHNTSGEQGHNFISNEAGQDTNNPLGSDHLYERNEEDSEGKTEDQNVASSSISTFSGKVSVFNDHVTAGTTSVVITTPENSYGFGGDCKNGSKVMEAENDGPKSKRRKTENLCHEAGISSEGAQEPQIAVQSSNDSEILGDGFRWRKYGQKVVKGNPYPRSYYRCTNVKCNVRKHVERASDDPRAFITTYEGKHNHDMPIKNPAPLVSGPDSKTA